MDTVFNLIRESLLSRCGLSGKVDFKKSPSLEIIRNGQCPHDLFEAADYRMIQGYFRYGAVNDTLGNFDYLKELERRIKLYKKTKNREYLADAVNMLRLQNELGKSKGESLKSIDDGYHAKEIK